MFKLRNMIMEFKSSTNKTLYTIITTCIILILEHHLDGVAKSNSLTFFIISYALESTSISSHTHIIVSSSLVYGTELKISLRLSAFISDVLTFNLDFSILLHSYVSPNNSNPTQISVTWTQGKNVKSLSI